LALKATSLATWDYGKKEPHPLGLAVYTDAWLSMLGAAGTKANPNGLARR